eukprot:CCRYP_019270-RB/>CCRYP_019270-RB protein AED:0.45 eAED:-0.37 QI:0/-1/0/1/-1/0/1/0/360
MYTNIKTDVALPAISEFIREELNNRQPHAYIEALIDALNIVFTNSIMKFGNTYWQQISSTGMGIAPAPPWATIFDALHERLLLPKWKSHLLLYKRFIDDIIGIWLPHPDSKTDSTLWSAFCQVAWSLVDRISPANKCNFMDLTLVLTTAETIETNLFEKRQNLYLYIPPGSAHSKGMIKGLIFGNTLRIIQLCSHKDDATHHLLKFKTRLIARGYSPETLNPPKAIAHAEAFISNANPNPDTIGAHTTYLHKILPQNSTYTWNSIQRTTNPTPFIAFGVNTSQSLRTLSLSGTCTTSCVRRSIWTDSLLPTVDHLIYGIGFLYAISLVGDGMSLVTWPSSFSSPIPFYFLPAGWDAHRIP